MLEIRKAYRILIERPEGKGPLGDLCYEDIVKTSSFINFGEIFD
jgi:hypothetical protein